MNIKFWLAIVVSLVLIVVGSVYLARSSNDTNNEDQSYDGKVGWILLIFGLAVFFASFQLFPTRMTSPNKYIQTMNK